MMLTYNLHTHTQFCDGHSTMAEIAAAAFDTGIKVLGFTPHCPIPLDSPCNMSADDIHLYSDEIERLRRQYDGRMQILKSMEIDYLGPDFGPASDLFDKMALDYRLGSVHFLPSTVTGEMIDMDGNYETFARKLHNHFSGDIDFVVRTYFNQVMEMLNAGKVDILGHYDKVSLNASAHRPGITSEPWYRRILSQVTDAVIASGAAVEINTKAYERFGRFFPEPSQWKALRSAGVRLVINSDTHRAGLIQSGRKEALTLLLAD